MQHDSRLFLPALVLLEKPPAPHRNMFALFWQIHSCSDARFIRRMLNSCPEQYQRCFDSGHAPASWNSTELALSQFGTFEAIVIPVLFFPSTILCALSGILITEAARATAANNQAHLQRLTKAVIQKTLQLSIFIAAGLLLYGNLIGTLLDGGALAGYLIRLLAPVVPFIYLEIVLEALLKGMGQQSFSSLNYLAEYTVRIAIVLVCIPKFGFYGIVLSYYASNVCGNCFRLWKTCKTARIRFSFWSDVGFPLFAAALAFQVPLCGLRLLHGMQFAWICLLPAILIDYALLKSYGKITAIPLLSKKQHACSSA